MQFDRDLPTDSTLQLSRDVDHGWSLTRSHISAVNYNKSNVANQAHSESTAATHPRSHPIRHQQGAPCHQPPRFAPQTRRPQRRSIFVRGPISVASSDRAHGPGTQHRSAAAQQHRSWRFGPRLAPRPRHGTQQLHRPLSPSPAIAVPQPGRWNARGRSAPARSPAAGAWLRVVGRDGGRAGGAAR